MTVSSQMHFALALAYTLIQMGASQGLNQHPRNYVWSLTIHTVLGIIGIVVVGFVLARFHYFLHERRVAGVKEEENATVCGTMAGCCPGPLKCCCGCTPQSLALATMWFSFLAVIGNAFRTNVLWGYSASNGGCILLYVLSIGSHGQHKMALLAFEYFRLIQSFQQSALRLKRGCNQCLGITLIVIEVYILCMLVATTMFFWVAPVPSVPGGVLCSANAPGLLRLLGQVNLLAGFGIEITLLIMFVYRINLVNKMTEEQMEPSSTSRKSKDGSEKERVSHFKTLAIKFATLTFVMTLTSFLAAVIGALVRAINIWQWILDAMVTAMCVWMTFHDEWAEKAYHYLCFPCDKLCVTCHPCAEVCCRKCVEESAHAAEALAQMTSISSRGMPSYASDLRKEDTGRSVGSVGSEERSAEI